MTLGNIYLTNIINYANNAIINPVAVGGDYGGFIIEIDDTSQNIGKNIKNAGTDAVNKFMEIIDYKILNKKFDDIFSHEDQMSREFGDKPKIRNLNAERVVISLEKNGYLFKW